MLVKAWKIRCRGHETGVALDSVELPEGLRDLDALSGFLPQGAYTSLRTYERRRAIRFERHLERLAETARLQGFSLPLDRDCLRTGVRLALEKYEPGGEVRIRLQVALETRVGETYIGLAPLATPPAEAYQQGVKTGTVVLQRSLPEAKRSRFIQETRAQREMLTGDLDEILCVDLDGNILEGISSNFFAVEAGKLRTAGEKILSGVTREIVLTLAEQLGIKVDLRPLKRTQLAQAEECFITSSSRGVLPVVEIDGEPVGRGQPGPVTRSIMEAYGQAVLEISAEI